MILLRIGLSLLLAIWSGYSCFGIVNNMFTTANIIEVSGILNTWGAISGLLVGSYLVVFWLKKLVDIRVPIGELNKVGVVLILVISPLLTVASYSKIQINSNNYIECVDLRKASLRFSSRTYAKNESFCHLQAND